MTAIRLEVAYQSWLRDVQRDDCDRLRAKWLGRQLTLINGPLHG